MARGQSGTNSGEVGVSESFTNPTERIKQPNQPGSGDHGVRSSNEPRTLVVSDFGSLNEYQQQGHHMVRHAKHNPFDSNIQSRFQNMEYSNTAYQRMKSLNTRQSWYVQPDSNA